MDNSYDSHKKYLRERGILGRGFKRGGFHGPHFQCGEEGHWAYEWPHNQERTNRRNGNNAREVNANEEDAKSLHSKEAEKGEVLMNIIALSNRDN